MLQHSTKKNHIEATKHSLDEKQNKLLFTCESGRKSTPSTSRVISLTFPGDDSLTAEILWLLKLAVSNFSLRSTDKLGELFQTMFPDSKIAAGFHSEPDQVIICHITWAFTIFHIYVG